MTATKQDLLKALGPWKRFADALSPEVPDSTSLGIFADGGMHFGPAGGACIGDLRRARDVAAKASETDGSKSENEFWWIYSDHKASWAGLRIAVFIVTIEGHQLFAILNEIPSRAGPRSWDGVSEREGWTKIERVIEPALPLVGDLS